jgi:hypothetical protein
MNPNVFFVLAAGTALLFGCAHKMDEGPDVKHNKKMVGTWCFADYEEGNNAPCAISGNVFHFYPSLFPNSGIEHKIYITDSTLYFPSERDFEMDFLPYEKKIPYFRKQFVGR